MGGTEVTVSVIGLISVVLMVSIPLWLGRKNEKVAVTEQRMGVSAPANGSGTAQSKVYEGYSNLYNQYERLLADAEKRYANRLAEEAKRCTDRVDVLEEIVTGLKAEIVELKKGGKN